MKTSAIALATVLVAVIGLGGVTFATHDQKGFDSLDDAVSALVSAARAADRKAMVEILGAAGRVLVSSGDDVADRAASQEFAAAYDQAHRLEGSAGKVVLYVGANDYPFPVPLVPVGSRWFWDTDAGRDEILSRRIGENELDAIQVCMAYVDAQREYYSEDRGAGMLEYARRLESTTGKHDGLVWEARPGEAPSPLGPLVAQAHAEGYPAPRRDRPVPYRGYLYRTLFAQGPDAPGGAYGFVVKGHMIGGFALVAFPAKYGDSGIMTFVVSHDGVVYEKDLGPQTSRLAGAMKVFNPDRTWRKVETVPPAR